MISQLRIGTRASPLALVQAERVAALFRAQHPACEIQTQRMTTAGDREIQKDLSQWGFKGLFTKELEDALLAGDIDIAVHSMKDMPSILPEGLMIGAVLARDDVRDGWVSAQYPSIHALPQGAIVGCSSVRRAAQLRCMRPDVQIVPLRGNVQTRLRKLSEGAAAATFLACAGLDRLHMAEHIAERIAPEVMLPAVAQAAIAIECRADNPKLREALTLLNDAATAECTTAERSMLAVLDGSCRTPIAGYATLAADGEITLRGELLMPDGSARITHRLHGHDAAALGNEVGEYLKAHAQPGMLAES
jgi:hydroxymethylbilane synthase